METQSTQQPYKLGMTSSATNPPPAALDDERKKQACEIIEHMIQDLVPSLDHRHVHRIALQLSSLQAVQRSVRSSGRDDNEAALRRTLRQIARRLLSVASNQHHPHVQSQEIPTEDALSLCSDDESQASLPTPLPTSMHHDDHHHSSLFLPKRIKHNHQGKAARHHLLMNRVGEEKYNQILSIAEEIKMIRYRSVTWTKFSNVNASTGEKLLPQNLDCHDVVDYESSNDPEEDVASSSNDIPASITLHKPIYDLYFQIRLMDVMATIDSKPSTAATASSTTTPNGQLLSGSYLSQPYPCQCVVEKVDWDALLLDAKNKLEAFRRFERENIGEDDQLGFRCGWRGCT
jgi:hypothetical protein